MKTFGRREFLISTGAASVACATQSASTACAAPAAEAARPAVTLDEVRRRVAAAGGIDLDRLDKFEEIIWFWTTFRSHAGADCAKLAIEERFRTSWASKLRAAGVDVPVGEVPADDRRLSLVMTPRYVIDAERGASLPARLADEATCSRWYCSSARCVPLFRDGRTPPHPAFEVILRVLELMEGQLAAGVAATVRDGACPARPRPSISFPRLVVGLEVSGEPLLNFYAYATLADC